MPNGNAVTNISVATSEQWTDKASGQKQERTEWHRITLFNRLGEIAGQFLKKGSQVYVEGSIRTDSYDDKNTGEKKYSTSIIASEMQMLGGKSDVNDNQPTRPPQQSQQAAPPSGGDYDDDVPFNRLHSYP